MNPVNQVNGLGRLEHLTQSYQLQPQRQTAATSTHHLSSYGHANGNPYGNLMEMDIAIVKNDFDSRSQSGLSTATPSPYVSPISGPIMNSTTVA